MQKSVKHCLKTVATIAFVVSSVSEANADFDSGLKAFQGRDYGMAFDQWQSCAAEKSAACQYGLGVLYDEGRAVQSDIYAALRWYERAARQAHPDAMMQLAFLYATGRGEVVQNAVLAWVWFSRAAVKGVPQAAIYRDRIGELLTESELAVAQRRAVQQSIEYFQR